MIVGNDVLQQRSEAMARSFMLLGLAFGILVLIAGSFFIGSHQIMADIERQERINVALPLLRQVYEDLQNAETGQRGYLLTGNVSYLEPYNFAAQKVDADVANLKKFYANDPVMTDRLIEVKALTDEKFQEMANTIQLRQNDQFEAALAIVKTDLGKRDMDQLRRVLSGMIEPLRSTRKELASEIILKVDWARNWLLLMGLQLIIVVIAAVNRLLLLNRLNNVLIYRLEKKSK